MKTFFDELRRRHAFRVAAGYLVVAWLLIQVADTMLPAFEAPSWVLKTFIVLVIAGFPVAIDAAWAFELTPEGLKRAEPMAPHEAKPTTIRKLDHAILGGLVLVILLIAADRLIPERQTAPPEAVGDVMPAAALTGEGSPASVGRAPPATYATPWDPAPPPEKSVAVLPFLVMSASRDDGYFADGLTEEIINRLTTLPELLVTARTSAFHFKSTPAAIPEIATVRITAQLIRAVDGFHLWSETYDRRLDDVFAVQTDIAENIADALGVLLDDEQRETMAEAGVRDVEAFLAFQRGQALYNAAHDEETQVTTLIRANAEFEAAIGRKPDFAQAHFMHSDLFVHVLTDVSHREARLAGPHRRPRRGESRRRHDGRDTARGRHARGGVPHLPVRGTVPSRSRSRIRAAVAGGKPPLAAAGTHRVSAEGLVSVTSAVVFRHFALTLRARSGALASLTDRGRHGFDGGRETPGACRGADHLVNPAAKPIVANDDNYALAA